MFALLVGAAGCGGGSAGGAGSLGNPPENGKPWDGPSAAHVRLDIAMEADVPRIVRAVRVTTRPVVRPVNGDLMAVAWASDGTVVDATPVRLGTTFRSSGFDERGNFFESEEEVAPASASATIFLADDPTLDRIEILRASGTAAVTLAAGEIEAETLRAGPTGSVAAVTLGDIQANFPWIELATPGYPSQLPAGLANRVEGLMPPSDEQLRDLEQCLVKMSEAGQLSVKTIAFGILNNKGRKTFPDGSCGLVTAVSEGSAMLINADITAPEVERCATGGGGKALRLVNACVHEGAHSFAMLMAAAGRYGSLQWPPEARKMAEEKVRTYDLAAGLEGLFEKLQDAAVAEADETMAVNYVEKGGPEHTTDKSAVEGGFASAYGAGNWREDLAEFASEIQAPNLPPGQEPAICQFFANAGPLSERTAIQYTKALLLRNIGLVDPGPFERCMHGLGIDAQPGISAPDSDFQFTSNLNFGYYDEGEERMFGIAGDGPSTYQALLRVRVENGQVPLGLHRLDRIDQFFEIEGANNAFLLANQDSLKARTSAGGLALISEITPHTTSGMIFFLQLAFTGTIPTDTFSIVTFRASK